MWQKAPFATLLASPRLRVRRRKPPVVHLLASVSLLAAFAVVAIAVALHSIATMVLR
jgi:hypothetical protein